MSLALDQAGAYIEETSCNLSEYLALYQRHHLALLQQQSSISTDYPHTVASTWALSFAQVQQQSPAAADLLRLCSFLHPDAIPEAIVTKRAADLGQVLSPVAADPFQLNEAMQILRHYSLFKRDPDAKLLNIHRLVQVVLMEGLEQQVRRQWAERAVRAVSRAFPEVEFASWESCEPYVPHALFSAQWIEQYDFTFPEAARLLHMAGIYLRDRGQYAQAEPLLKKALSLRKQVLGPEHPKTANTLNTLAWLYVLQGNYQQAEQLVQPALENFERVLGSEHPEFAVALDTLASLYMSEGKYIQAEPLIERVLATRERVLGPEHPDTDMVLRDLGRLYSLQGKYAQAEPHLQRALRVLKQLLGPEHQFTIRNLHYLAQLSQATGQEALAESLYQHALGSEHPQTATVLDTQGHLALLQGREEQAELFLQRALAIQELALGKSHPDVAHTLHHLARLHEKLGKHEQARSLYQKAFPIREQALSPDHPDIIAVRVDYTNLLKKMKQSTEAAKQEGS